MPNVFKYSPGGSGPGTLKKGDFLIGNNTADYGGTYYTGITPATGGYTIYLNKATQGPSIFTAENDSVLIDLTNKHIAGNPESPTGYTTAAQCLEYFSGQSDKVCVNRDYEEIVTDKLVLNLDAGFTPSYPKGGTSWYGICNQINGSLTNSPTFNSSNGGSILFDGSDDYCQFTSLPPGYQAGMTNYSISIWFKLNSSKEAPLLEMGTTNEDFKRIMFWVTGGTPNRLYALGASSNSGYRRSSVDLTTGSIYNAVYTYNNTGTISKLYVNSIEDTGLTNSTTNGLLTALNSSWTIAGDNVYNHSYCQTANIYNVLLYTKTLSSSEVLQNYNSQKSRFGL